MNSKTNNTYIQRRLHRAATMFCAVFIIGSIMAGVKPGFCGEIIEIGHQAILTEQPDKIVSAGFWIPTEQQTAEALLAVYNYLTKLSKAKKKDMPAITSQNSTALTKRQVSRIRNGLWKYRVQFIGLNFDNRKVIYCNFFIYDPKRFARWKNEYVDVSTGGTAFWQIDYDVNSKQCADLTINSEDLKGKPVRH